MILKNRFHYKGQTKSSSLVRMTPLLVVISLSELVVKGPVRIAFLSKMVDYIFALITQ